MNVTIKQNDTKCLFTDTLTVNGTPVDGTNATVSFIMRGVGCVGVAQAAAWVNPPGTDGKVQYQPILADVARFGQYQQQWRVTFADSKVLTFPNDGYNIVTILPALI